MKLPLNRRLLSAIVGLTTLVAGTAHADLMPSHRPHPPRHAVYRCTEIPGDTNGPEAGKLDEFLKDPSFKHATEPTVNKLDNGNYRVCAIFEV